jgi:predicted dinucleotide-binding enzyme
MDISIVGGTGAEGFGLALRLAKAGHDITIGSRMAEKAAASVEEA